MIVWLNGCVEFTWFENIEVVRLDMAQVCYIDCVIGCIEITQSKDNQVVKQVMMIVWLIDFNRLFQRQSIFK